MENRQIRIKTTKERIIENQKGESIIDKGCDYLGIEKSVLLSPLRTPYICDYRFMFMKLLRSLTELTLKETAEILGRDNHATIILGIKKCNDYIGNEDDYRNKFNNLKKHILN